MRWRPAFMAEVFGWLQQLGLTACPQCGSANSLRTSPVPVRLAESGAPLPAVMAATRDQTARVT